MGPRHIPGRALPEDHGRTAMTGRISSALRRFLSRLRGLFGGTRRDRDLRAEIEGHVDEATEENIRRGQPPLEARRLALAHFGGVTQTMEIHRERRRFTVFAMLGQDL